MGIQIEGHSSSRIAGVSEENRLQTESIRMTTAEHTNKDEKEAYYLEFEQSPTANDDCIVYILNESEKDLIVNAILLQVSAACDVYIKLKDTGTRNSPTSLIPTNGNAGSGNIADGTFEYGADLDGGAATLSGGSIVASFRFIAATNSTVYAPPADWILPKNTSMTIWCSSSAATVKGNVLFYYH